MQKHSPLLTLLCVDDNDDNLLSLSLMLQQAGYRVLEAGTGREALALAKRADLVVLDVQLPDLSGFEICQRIKADPATALVPVILLSGRFTRSDDLAAGLEGGGDVYLTKPADPQVLLSQIKALGRIRQIELALQEQAKIIDQIHDAVIATDLEGRVTQWNKGAERMLGYAADEMLGRHIALFNPPGEGEAAYSQVLVALREGGKFELEKRLRRKSGEEFYVYSSFALLIDSRGEMVGVISYSLDITERKRLEEQVRQDELRKLNAELEDRVRDRTAQLETANKELEAFCYSVSHDLRVPLRAIDGISQELLQTYGEKLDEQGQHYLQRVRAGSQRMAQLIDDLLQLSRLSRGEMQRQRVDLSALVAATLSELKRLEPGRQADFVIEPGLNAYGDPGLVRLVLENLLGNAWKFTSKHRRAAIEFGKAESGGQTAFFIRDNGAGFNPAFAEKLFGAFQRLHKERDFPGTGIGLATVQRIIHRHGGRVWAEGAIEKGAVFYFTLPERGDA